MLREGSLENEKRDIKEKLKDLLITDLLHYIIIILFVILKKKRPKTYFRGYLLTYLLTYLRISSVSMMTVLHSL